MLRAVADIYAQMGDTPLEEEGWEREEISNAIYFITNKHDFQDFIQPWKDAFLRNPIDVTDAKKWGLNTLKVAGIKEYHVITRNTKIKKANKWNKEK